MTTSRRLAALATTIFVVSTGASAASLTLPVIDFESDGSDAINGKAPVGVKSVSNGRLTFSNAWGYAWQMLSPTLDSSALPGEFDGGTCAISPAKCNEGGFIVNRNRGDTDGSKISLSLATSSPALAGAYFESITFDSFTWSSVRPRIYFYNAGGAELASDQLNADDGFKFWSYGTFIDMSSLLLPSGDRFLVTRILFDVGQSTIGLDNLKVTLGGVTSPPSSVPEPSSYALVGLALLAVGFARRRNT